MKRKKVLEWRPYIQPILHSKLNEFKFLGYSEITDEEIWQCLMEKVWKGNPSKRLYEVTEDVLSLSASTYMNFVQIDALGAEEDDLLSSIKALTEQTD